MMNCVKMIFFGLCGFFALFGPIACTPVLAQQEASISLPASESAADKTLRSKLELEMQSLRDKAGKVQGIESEFKMHVELPLLLGVQVSEVRESGKDRIGRWDQIFIGWSERYETFLPLKVELVAAFYPEEKLRMKNHRQGHLELDLKSSALKSTHFRVGLRAQFREYLRTVERSSVEQRRSRLEINPAFVLARWRLGLRNKLQHRFLQNEDQSTFDTGPFVSYQGKIFEPTFKVSYRPFISGDNSYFAEAWDSKPVYAFELEARFN